MDGAGNVIGHWNSNHAVRHSDNPTTCRAVALRRWVMGSRNAGCSHRCRKTGDQPSILKMAALENPATAIAEDRAKPAPHRRSFAGCRYRRFGDRSRQRLGATERKGADVVHAVGDALTYQPRGEMGKQATEIATYPFQKLAEAGQWAGGKRHWMLPEARRWPRQFTRIQGVLPMVAGPMAKKGGSAIRERFSKPETGAEAIAPESQATNAAPAMAEAARPAQSALAFDSAIPAREMIDGVFRTETEIPAEYMAWWNMKAPCQNPKHRQWGSIRRPGDQGLRRSRRTASSGF